MLFPIEGLCQKIVVCGVAAFLAMALSAIPSAADEAEPKGIGVNGHGEVKAEPDVARVMVSVLTQSKDQGQAAEQNAKLTTAVRDALMTKFNLAKKDLETFGYNIQPQYDYQARPPKVVGYQVRNTIRVSIKDLTKTGQVIDAATAAGANEIQGVSFEVENDAALRNEALVKALTNAKEKAELIAKTLGVQVGPVVSVRETSAPSVMPMRMMMAAEAKMAGAPETPIEAREMTVTADVTVVFGIIIM